MIAGDCFVTFALGIRYRTTFGHRRCCANMPFRNTTSWTTFSTSPPLPRTTFPSSVENGRTVCLGCYAAGLVAGLEGDEAEAPERFGMELGIAFQLVDDLLDLFGDERM